MEIIVLQNSPLDILEGYLFSPKYSNYDITFSYLLTSMPTKSTIIIDDEELISEPFENIETLFKSYIY